MNESIEEKNKYLAYIALLSNSCKWWREKREQEKKRSTSVKVQSTQNQDKPHHMCINDIFLHEHKFTYNKEKSLYVIENVSL